jgi:hypothetical protein
MPILYTKARPSGTRLPPSWWSTTSSNDWWYDNLGDELTPNTPQIDVVNDFPWTLTPTTSQARKEAPYIFLREFLQLETQLNQSLLPYSKSLAGNLVPVSNLPFDPANPAFGPSPQGEPDEQGFLETLKDIANGIEAALDTIGPLRPDTDALYKGLFDHLYPTNFQYRLPFFTPEYFDVKNNWEGVDILDTLISLQTQVGGLIRTGLEAKFEGSKIGKFLQNLPANLKKFEIFNIQSSNPSVGLMDPPHVWKSATNRTYTFEFPLYNISSFGEANTTDLIVKNWELCFLLTYQNLVNKRNYYTAIPPVFYEVNIPGVHYCKASYISDLTINNMGNIRLQKLPINGIQDCHVNVPDAYLIQITLTDLLQPSKNLLQAVTNSNYRTQIQSGRRAGSRNSTDPGEGI